MFCVKTTHKERILDLEVSPGLSSSQVGWGWIWEKCSSSSSTSTSCRPNILSEGTRSFVEIKIKRFFFFGWCRCLGISYLTVSRSMGMNRAKNESVPCVLPLFSTKILIKMQWCLNCCAVCPVNKKTPYEAKVPKEMRFDIKIDSETLRHLYFVNFSRYHQPIKKETQSTSVFDIVHFTEKW